MAGRSLGSPTNRPTLSGVRSGTARHTARHALARSLRQRGAGQGQTADRRTDERTMPAGRAARVLGLPPSRLHVSQECQWSVRLCARRRAGILNIALLATCSVRTYVVPVHAARSWRATRPPAAAPRGFCAVGATTTGPDGPARSKSATTWHAQRAPPATASDHPPVRHRTAPHRRQLKRYRTRTHPRRVLACLSPQQLQQQQPCRAH